MGRRRELPSGLVGHGVTAREAEVLAAVGERLTNAEIAARLYVSARTVETHIGSLLRKLGAANRRELARVWMTSTAASTPRRPPLPPALELLADPATYVGRPEERSTLRGLWHRAQQGKLLVAVIVGEAGIGKSRIAAELALEVHAGGGQVCLGSCLEDLGVPYEPFVQMLDSDATSLHDTALAERVGSSGAVLGRLSPKLAGRLGLASTAEADGPGGRAELPMALRDYLDRAARQSPLLVVIEDLHWSTATTRESLRYLTRLGGSAPTLFLLTCRDAAPDLDAEVAGFLGELGRHSCVEVISLAALTEADVAELLAVTGRSRPAGEVFAATGGNPLFALEASRAERGLGSLGSLLSARFDRLAPAEADVVDVAVVIGSEFRADLVAAAAGRDLESVLEALESAEDAGLVAADPGDPLHFSFVHALFRTVRYDSMRTSARLRRHAAIAEALRPRADDERVLPLLAHHACAAAPLGRAEDAVLFARRAGQSARRRRGYDEAAEQYQRALSMLELAPTAAPGLGLLLRIDLATALVEAGRPDGWTLLQAAIEEARRHADDEALAHATIALSGITGSLSFGGPVDHEIAAMFSEALERVPDEPSRLRARLLVGLGGRLPPEDLLRARRLASAGVEMARELGDLSAVGDGLMTHRWLIFEPALAVERIAVGEELIALGRLLDDPKFTTGGLSQLLHVHREAGDFEAAARVRAEMEALNELRPHPVAQSIVITYQATERFLAGDLAGAEATAEGLLDFGSEIGAFNLYALILGSIRYQQGRAGELIPFIEKAAAEQSTFRRFLTAMLAHSLARAGRLDDAADAVHSLAVHDYDMPHNGDWFLGTVHLADAIEIIGDTAVAAVLRERLTPFAGRIANSSAGVLRPVDQALAQLALMLDDVDAAASAAGRAVAASRSRSTPVFLGRELVLLATASRRAGASRREILPLLDEAQQIAEATGAHLIVQEIARYGLR